MVVHFSSSAKRIRERAEILRYICGIISDNGHTLARDWLDEAVRATEAQKVDQNRWRKIAAETLDAVRKADVVIIEVSLDSFSMGYQAALAVSLKKPLLLLRSFNIFNNPEFSDHSQKTSTVEYTLIAGEKSRMQKVEVYSSKEQLEKLITTFLKANEIDTKDMRFNMFLDRETYLFLKSQSTDTGQTKAKIVRDILHDKIRSDSPDLP